MPQIRHSPGQVYSSADSEIPQSGIMAVGVSKRYKIRTGEDMEKIKARITVNREFVKGEIDRRIYGSFVEHMGRVVYSGS